MRTVKERWAAFLKRLATQNKKTYGDGGVDCCKANRISNQKE